MEVKLIVAGALWFGGLVMLLVLIIIARKKNHDDLNIEKNRADLTRGRVS